MKFAYFISAGERRGLDGKCVGVFFLFLFFFSFDVFWSRKSGVVDLGLGV